MKISDYLKKQFLDFIEVYRNYFWRTLGITFACSILCIVSAAILLRFSDFEQSNASKQVSLLSYFFHFYSKGDTYSIVDLTKSVFIFFVAFFSLSLIRTENIEAEHKEISFSEFVKKITIKDFASLICILLIVAFIDFILFKISGFFSSDSSFNSLNRYIHGLLYELRVYVPLILFSLSIYALSLKEGFKLTLKRLFILFISLWIFNVLAYELTLWIRSYVFGLILMPVSNIERFYFLESFLGIPLIVIYFLGYYSAMTNVLKQFDE
jgi:hypothetical protein